ncbi:MAG TPA: hypothetical protein VNU93_10280 [Verrucomicrobiae bacterium]|nr:hypothetical protein [Verrucomicrobiae bacterium]
MNTSNNMEWMDCLLRRVETMQRRNTIFTAFILLTIATAIFGEISFFPFKSGFRFGLGSTVYFLGIILYPELLELWVGAGVGLAVVVFRVGLDMLFTSGHVALAGLVGARLPALTYYLFLTFLAKFFKAAKYRDRPLFLGLMVSVFDLFSNSFEYLVWNKFNIGGYELGEIGIVALLKGFIIIGVVSIFSVYKLRILQEQERLRFEKLLLVASGLYQETFFLRKAMGHIEKITAKSFEIYQQLKREEKGSKLPGLALEVSEEVHEIKKDVQRVVAGLTKLVDV